MTDTPLITSQALLAERHRYFVAAGGGISLPVAGAIYWILLGILGSRLPLADWALFAAAGSGMIFPLGLLLQKPLRANFMKAKSPVGGAAIWAVMGINFLWPMHFAVIGVQPELTVLTLAIGMTIHWVVIGWSYASKACFIHAFARMIVVTGMFYAMPEARLTLLPFAIAVLYLLAAGGIAFEVSMLRRRQAQ